MLFRRVEARRNQGGKRYSDALPTLRGAYIDAEQKAPLSAELASPRARPEVNPAPAEEPQRGPAEPYDKDAAKVTLESFVPNVREGTHTSRPIGPH